jgi:hypothetical protein
MFNRYIDDDMKAREELVDAAVSRARPNGVQEAKGNSANAPGTGSFSSGVPVVEGNDGAGPTGQSGIDASGKRYYPFIWGVDTFEDEAAYWVQGAPQG